MTQAEICILVTMILYLGAMLGIGFLYNQKGSTTTSGDFYLGNRKLGPIVTAMSAEASDMSSYLLMGLPGLAYLCGLAEVGWTAIGLAVGTYLNFLFVAKRLRRYSERIGAITIPDYFSRRFGDKKAVLSCVAAIVIIVFFVPYTASGFKAVGTLFSSLFGWDYHIAMIVGAVVIVTYTVLGGFMAVSMTDLIQSIFMTIALVVIVAFGIRTAGGWTQVVENAKALPGYLNMTQGYNAATNSAATFDVFSICTTLAWGLGYFGMPHILLRFMAIRNENEIKHSRRIACVWVVLSMCIAVLIGVIGLSVSKAGALPMLTTSSESETIIIRLSELMSGGGIWLAIAAGVILSGILAATMSTADSQLLAASSSVSKDLLEDFFGIKLSAKASMLAARLTVAVIAVVGIVLAWNPNSSVFRVVSFAWAGFGASFGPVMLFSLFWKRTNRWGALAGMLVGGIMVFVWKYLIAPIGGIFAIYELLPAFLLSCVAILVFSLATAAPEAEIQATFDEVRKQK